MKELIKMKPNWVVEHNILTDSKTNFILVSNYDSLGRVCNFGYFEKEEANQYKDSFDLGIWHVKYKELK